MPLFDFLCADCGKEFEILVSGSAEAVKCSYCGSLEIKKLLSAHSSFTGSKSHGMPGPGDTACCGSEPGHGGCAGPGSCCGKS